MGLQPFIISPRAAARLLQAVLLGLSAQLLHAEQAPPISLEEALSLAHANAPALSAASQGVQAAQASAVSAGQLPDPVLRAGVDNLPINGADRFSLDRDFMTMRRIGLMQEYVSTEKRQLQRKRNELEAASADLTRVATQANLRRDVALAWLDRYYAIKNRELLTSLQNEVQLQLRTLDSQLRAGKAMATEQQLAAAMLLQIDDRVLDNDRQERVAIINLSRWLGAAAQRTPGQLPDIRRLPESLVHGDVVHAAPQLRQHEQELNIARTELTLAEQNRSPNWSWEIAYQQRGSDYSNMVSFGVSVPLTFNAARRQDQDVAARRAQLSQAEQVHEDMVRETRTNLLSAHAEWQTLIDRHQKLAAALLPITQQRVELSLAAYRSGQTTLANVLEARRAEVEARMQLLELEREMARLWAQLQFVYVDPMNALPQGGTQP